MTPLLTLKTKTSTTLHPSSPFNFHATMHKPSHFPAPLTSYEKNALWQTMRIDRERIGIKMKNTGTTNHPAIKLTIFSTSHLKKETIDAIKKELVWRYDLDANLSEFNQQFKHDNVLGPAIRTWKGMRVSSAHSLYELIVISVVLQNATVRRSASMLNTLLEHYGTLLRFDTKKLSIMWQPEKLANVDEQHLRNLKVGYRAKFLIRLSQDFAQHTVDEMHLRTLKKEDAKKELLKLFGVGPETARILLFETLHHYDVFDHIAPWQQKIYSRLFYHKKLVSSNKIKHEILKRYGTWSMLAVHYLWEDLFWQRKREHIDWLEREIRL